MIVIGDMVPFSSQFAVLRSFCGLNFGSVVLIARCMVVVSSRHTNEICRLNLNQRETHVVGVRLYVFGENLLTAFNC
jgi:hypothetical protein